MMGVKSRGRGFRPWAARIKYETASMKGKSTASDRCGASHVSELVNRVDFSLSLSLSVFVAGRGRRGTQWIGSTQVGAR